MLCSRVGKRKEQRQPEKEMWVKEQDVGIQKSFQSYVLLNATVDPPQGNYSLKRATQNVTT